jgi:hypothetical protein
MTIPSLEDHLKQKMPGARGVSESRRLAYLLDVGVLAVVAFFHSYMT